MVTCVLYTSEVESSCILTFEGCSFEFSYNVCYNDGTLEGRTIEHHGDMVRG